MSHEGSPAAAGGRAVAAGPWISFDLVGPCRYDTLETLNVGSFAMLPSGGQKCRGLGGSATAFKLWRDPLFSP